MLQNTLKKILVPALAIFAPLFAMAEFTQKDLEKMVRELEAVAPKNPDYAYPIKCIIEQDDDVNAGATVTFYDDEENELDKPQALMIVNTGLVKEWKEDLSLIRAVCAHEIAHLSKGHPTNSGFKPGDVQNAFVRQMEHEADIVGTSILVAAGYPKKDMIRVMEALDDLSSDTPLMSRLMADHASGAARAAKVADDPMVYRSMADYQLGMAFLENRSYFPAMEAFDRAIAKEPKFKEAYTSSAQAALMFFYDRLPVEFKNSFFRPDFGPILQPSGVDSRAQNVDDADLRRYKQALGKVAAAVQNNGQDARTKELAALAQVLDPEAGSANLSQGLKDLQSQLAATVNAVDKLRIANNIALAQQRSGNITQALRTLIEANNATDAFNAFVAENLGAREMPSVKDQEEAKSTIGALITWLRTTPSSSPNYKSVRANYEAMCTKYNFVKVNVEEVPIYLCSATSITFRDKTVSLLDPWKKLVDQLGKATKAWSFDKNFPDFLELQWEELQLNVLTDNDGLLRVTSYDPGATVILKPKDDTLSHEFKITVGMTVEELKEFLNVDGAIERPFVRCGSVENWLYFPGLIMGVCVKDDKVIGVTVSPYDWNKLGD